jgi:transcriptional regulator with XRE-family HTH domain
MANYIAENLSFLRRHNDLSQEKMAEILEIKRSSLSAYELGKAEPSIEVILNYSKYFNLSLDDLVSKPLKDNLHLLSAHDDKRAFKVLAITVGDDNEENIELVNEKAAAGYTYAYGDPEYVRNLPRFRLPFLRGGTFRAFEIRGDSMLPVLSGSIVIGEYIENMRDVKSDESYIFNTRNNGVLFKRVAGIDKIHIVLKSDNGAYASYSLPLEEIQEVWKTRIIMSGKFS